MFKRSDDSTKKIKKQVNGNFIVRMWFKFKSLSFTKHLFIFYFLITLFGALLLFASVSHQATVKHIGFEDALFTAASAFSDTGLTPLTTATTFNYFGQAIIAILIFVGGIGWFALKVYFFNILFGRPISFASRDALAAERGSSNIGVTRNLVKVAVTILLTLVVIAALILSLYFYFVQPTNLNTVLHDYKPNTNTKLLSSNFGESSNSYSSDGHTPFNPYHNWSTSIRYGIFHSISAINNAGFDIMGGNSIAGYYSSYGLQFIFIILFVIGGVGYPVIYDLWMKFKGLFTGKKHKFSLFSKISMSAYIVITLVGLAIAFSIELSAHDNSRINPNTQDINGNYTGKEVYASFWNNKDYGSKGSKVMAIFFNTMSTRNAGFATVNMGIFSPGTQIVYIVMMFIGSAPSSTAGGIRTTTMAIIALGLWSRIKGKNTVRAFNRRIPGETVKNSYIVFSAALIITIIASLIVMTSLQIHGGNLNALVPKIDPTTGKQEMLLNKNNQMIPQFTENINHITGQRYSFTEVIFEVGSAFGTTGLSAGITSHLSVAAKITLIFVMFVGQLGVSSSILVWTRKNPKSRHYRYVKEDVSIG